MDEIHFSGGLRPPRKGSPAYEDEALERQNKLDFIERQQLEEQIISILSPFFETSIYGAKSTYYAFVENKMLRGKQVHNLCG